MNRIIDHDEMIKFTLR